MALVKQGQTLTKQPLKNIGTDSFLSHLHLVIHPPPCSRGQRGGKVGGAPTLIRQLTSRAPIVFLGSILIFDPDPLSSHRDARI